MNIITTSLSTLLLTLTLATASAEVKAIQPTGKIPLPSEHAPTAEEAAVFEKELEAAKAKPVTVVLHQGNNGAKVTIPNGAIVIVILETQVASTGYDWSPAFSSSNILSFQSKNIKDDAPTNPMGDPILGVPCRESWIFKATTPGQTLLTFSLVCPWEKDVPPVQTVQFNITVD